MSVYEDLKQRLLSEPKHWLVTGVAGFIGSNLLETLLKLNQKVTGLDNFSTGNRRNLEQVRRNVDARQWKLFSLLDGDIRNLETCRKACRRIDLILHQAALGSVPLSVRDPIQSNASNVSGF